MGFFDSEISFEEAKKIEVGNNLGNLTPGRYKLLISAVETGKHARGESFIPTTDVNFAGDDAELRFQCCLTDKVGEFPAGWKHTFFFQPKTRDPQDASKLSVSARVALKNMTEITEACGMSGWPKSEQEYVGKQFVVTLKYGYAKNDTAKEKPFINIDKVEPVSAWDAPVQTAPATNASVASAPAQATNSNVPNWD